MQLNGLHFMLTWQCILECDHCFVWGGPQRSGTWTLANLTQVLDQARELGTVEWIYYEGGEPFLYYPLLVEAVRAAAGRGFRVGVVTNAYWATTLEDALNWLRPLAGLVEDFSVSSDLYHWEEALSRQAQVACAAAKTLGIPAGVIQVAQPQGLEWQAGPEAHPSEGGTLMYRGRAAVKLSGKVPHRPWMEFTHCPYEDLQAPGRVHLDPFGNLHLCQGIMLGNVLATPLADLSAAYDPYAHPIVGPLLQAGPAELVRRYALPRQEAYADACHLCYCARSALREKFPAILGPDGMYAG